MDNTILNNNANLTSDKWIVLMCNLGVIHVCIHNKMFHMTHLGDLINTVFKCFGKKQSDTIKLCKV